VPALRVSQAHTRQERLGELRSELICFGSVFIAGAARHREQIGTKHALRRNAHPLAPSSALADWCAMFQGT
jgi:hypothetical protein